jgi:hypothetical protein
VAAAAAAAAVVVVVVVVVNNERPSFGAGRQHIYSTSVRETNVHTPMASASFTSLVFHSYCCAHLNPNTTHTPVRPAA